MVAVRELDKDCATMNLMGLRHKLLLSLAFIATPNVIVLIYGTTRLQSIDERLLRINAHLTPSLRILQKFQQEIQVATQLMDLKFYQQPDPNGFPSPWLTQLERIHRHLKEIATSNKTASAMLPRIQMLIQQVNQRETRKLLEEVPLIARWFEREIAMESLLTQNELRETLKRLGMTLIMTLLASVLVILFAHYNLKRFSILVDGIKAVAKGRFKLLIDAKTPLHRPAKDEIDMLAREFNNMVLQLEKRQEKLERQRVTLQEALEQNQYRETVLHGVVAFFDKTLNHLPMDLRLFDASGGLIFENEQCRERAAQTIDDMSASFEKEEEVIDKLENALSEMKPSRLGIYQERKTARYWDLIAAPIRLLDREQPLLLVLQTDRTEEVQAKQKLLHAERLAAMGSLSAQVAHEIRNPLNAMGLNLEMLAESLPPQSEMLRHLHLALEEIQRLERLTAVYLEKASLKDGLHVSTAMSEKKLSLSEAIRRAVSLFQEVAQKNKIQFQFNGLIENDRSEISADAIMAILINLIRNSLAAVDKEGVIEIGMSLENSRFKLWIEDTGHGISKDHRTNVLEPYFTTSKTGSGLGFSIILKHLQNMHGTLEIKDPLRLTGVRIECNGELNHERSLQNSYC